jgi:hypothetical protein
MFSIRLLVQFRRMLGVMTFGIEKRFDLVGKLEWIEKETPPVREWRATIAASLTSISLSLVTYSEWPASHTGGFYSTWESTPSNTHTPCLFVRKLCVPQSLSRRIERGAWSSFRSQWLCFPSSNSDNLVRSEYLGFGLSGKLFVTVLVRCILYGYFVSSETHTKSVRRNYFVCWGWSS